MSCACFTGGTHFCSNERVGADRVGMFKRKLAAFGFNLVSSRSADTPDRRGSYEERWVWFNVVWRLRANWNLGQVRLLTPVVCYLSPSLSYIKVHAVLKRAAILRLLNVHLSHSSICLSTSTRPRLSSRRTCSLAFHGRTKDAVPPRRPGSPPSWMFLKHHSKETSGTHLCQMPKVPTSAVDFSEIQVDLLRLTPTRSCMDSINKPKTSFPDLPLHFEKGFKAAV